MTTLTPWLSPQSLAPTTSGARRGFQQRVLMLGLTPLAAQLVRDIETHRFGRRVIVGIVDDGSGGVEQQTHGIAVHPLCRLRETISELRPDCIVVALVERRGRTPVRELLDACVPRGVIVEDVADFYERVTGKLAIESLRPTSIVFSRRFRPSRLHQAFARALSLMVALVGLLLSAPLLALIALAIRLDSPGPVLFVQPRAGKDRRPFELLKFRTMHVTTARHSEWAGDNGNRVTRVGRWLRKLRLDELPQFVNIVRGEMTLVGPRPHPVSNLDLFTLVARNLNELPGTAIGYYELRSLVPPGLTGWAQVRYGYANNLEQEIEKLRFDLFYVKYASPWLDVRILFETVRVMLFGRLSDGLPRAGQVRATGAGE
jgi:exopolysaccharide biosynthesis polyprenyl glycosylphosphotransferase